MKRVVTAVALLSIAVITSVWANFIFESDMNALLQSLQSVLDSVESDSDEVLHQKTDELIALWNKSSGILYSLVMHQSINGIEENITALPLILKHSGREEFKSKCIESINQIKNLLNSEKLNLQNIL